MTMQSLRLATLLALGLSLAGCAGMNETQQRTATGALGGGAVGGIIGSFSGKAGLGALLGAGVGGAGGYIYDQSQQSQRPQRSSYDDRSRYSDGYRGR
jgi:outer membrane lipoprotein SlyB